MLNSAIGGRDPPDVLLFVLLGDQDVGAVGLEVMRSDLPQDLHVDGEVHLQAAVLNVVVPEGGVKKEPACKTRSHWRQTVKPNSVSVGWRGPVTLG